MNAVAGTGKYITGKTDKPYKKKSASKKFRKKR